MQSCFLFILACPQTPLNENELNALKTFVTGGGRVLILLTESNQDDKSNINVLLEDYGIVPNMGKLILLKVTFQYAAN